jgi:hypothetical protein
VNKTILRKKIARIASFGLLTLSLLLACSCSGLAGKDSAPGTGEGWALVPDILSRIVPPTFPDRDFVVTDYGAVGDGVTDCNPAFKKAIAACTKAGGGRVVVPKGTFLTNGPIHLDNNVNLHVTRKATIMFGTNFDDYLPHVRVRWEGTECYNYSPLIYAYKKTNIALTGSGTLNGQAESSWAMWPDKEKPGTISNEVLRKMGKEATPVEDRVFYGKPTMIEPFECTNVLIEGVTLNDYPFWCVHPTFCTNVTIRKLRIESHNSNNDGIDPDSSKDVLIEDCYLDQSDDCLAIKAGRDQDAWRSGKPCENIIVRNMPTNFDGIAIGSECSGGVRNVFVYDCEYESGNVLYCKSNLDRGGYIKDIYVKNLKIGKARILRLRNNYHGYRGGNFPTEFRNINIEDVHIKEGDDETISITGVEGALVYDVFIKNVVVDTVSPPVLQIRLAENVILTNVSIAGEIQPTHPPLLPPEPKELEGTASIAPRRSGKWSDPSNWETGRDGARLNWAGDAADRLPDDKIDERVLIGKSRVVPDGVTVTLDRNIDGEFEVRVYEQSTFIIPEGYTLKIKGPFIVDRTNSVARQLGGILDVQKNLDIDTETGQYLITGGSLKVGDALSLNEGTFIVDDSASAITSITVGDEFRTGEGEGDTTTKFIAHKGGVTPIQTKDILLDAYIGENLIVDVTKYDYAANGDLVLFSYTGIRKGEFDGGPEKPAPQVTIIGAKAELVYDDAGKKIKLTNFHP